MNICAVRTLKDQPPMIGVLYYDFLPHEPKSAHRIIMRYITPEPAPLPMFAVCKHCGEVYEEDK